MGDGTGTDGGAKPVSLERWNFAQRHERAYQLAKRHSIAGQELAIVQRSERVGRKTAEKIEALGYPARDGLVVEIGSGAHGLIWRWPAERRVAIDPLACFYAEQFGFLQRNGPGIVEARGEAIPLSSGCASLVISDNVLDHAPDPALFLRECRRLLSARGALYITVNVHHPLWHLGASAYNTLFSLGVRLNLPAFPHHPHHFTGSRIDALMESAGLRVVHAAGGAPRGARGLLPFKNVRYEMLAVRS